MDHDAGRIDHPDRVWLARIRARWPIESLERGHDLGSERFDRPRRRPTLDPCPLVVDHGPRHRQDCVGVTIAGAWSGSRKYPLDARGFAVPARLGGHEVSVTNLRREGAARSRRTRANACGR